MTLIYIKSKLKEHFGCGIFITGLHDDVNVVAFRYIAAPIVFH